MTVLWNVLLTPVVRNRSVKGKFSTTITSSSGMLKTSLAAIVTANSISVKCCGEQVEMYVEVDSVRPHVRHDAKQIRQERRNLPMIQETHSRGAEKECFTVM